MAFIDLPAANGLRLYCAEPAAPGPGVLVLHAWWGLVPDVLGVCDRLAANGFLAVAPDLYGGKVASTPEEAEALVEAGDWQSRQAMTAAAIRWLQGHSALAPKRVALLGFSLGGAVAIRAAANGLGDAVITFYGSIEPGGPIRIPLLGLYAETDPFEPAEEVAALLKRLEGEGTPVSAITYPGTGHWFFEESRSAYDPVAAQAAWDESLRFLRRHLQG